jgi:hypothetical protein
MMRSHGRFIPIRPGDLQPGFQASPGARINLKLHDVNVKLVREAGLSANGFVQKHTIDLQPAKFASGLYMPVAQ